MQINRAMLTPDLCLIIKNPVILLNDDLRPSPDESKMGRGERMNNWVFNSPSQMFIVRARERDAQAL